MINTNSSIPIIGIYKITSPTNRIYIGQSTDIEKRFKKYKNNCNGQKLIIRSFKKYGVKNHIFEKIEECSIEQLNERERYWQDHYDVLNGGLNCVLTKTDDKSGNISEATRQKMIECKQNMSEDTKLKMSESSKGKPKSEEHRLKMIEVKNLDKYRLAKPIAQYDLEGNFIQDWKSIKDASDAYKLNRGGISGCCSGRTKRFGNFKWKYKE